MKPNFKIAALVIGAFLINTTIDAQTNSEKNATTHPSDVSSGFTYDFDKTISLITERLTNPTSSNADVQVFLNQPDFPVLGKGKSIDASYKDELRKWMEKNPTLIINTLKTRKDIVTQY